MIKLQRELTRKTYLRLQKLRRQYPTGAWQPATGTKDLMN
jgi:hypothetical protein